jgi:hypothetical protein
MRRTLPLFLCLLLLGLLVFFTTPDMNSFPPPRSAPEKALAALLKSEEIMTKGTSSYDYLVGREGSEHHPLYAQYFTDALRSALEKNCDGKEIEGELCGLEFHPVTCTQDLSDTYLFRTEKETDDTAIISYQWPGDSSIAATYRLQKIESRWKLDGVFCPEYIRFNWHGDK